MKYLKKFNFRDQDTKFLFILLSGDLFYFLLFLTSKAARFLDIGTSIRSPAFELTRDLGLPESYQYVKEFWIVILLFWFIYKTKTYQFVSWAFLYAYLLADDMLKIHEDMSSYLITKLGFISEQRLFQEFRYQDIGEFSISSLAGIFFLIIILFSYYKANQEQRKIFRQMTGLFLALVFFGVFIDMIDQLIPSTAPKLEVFLVDTIEDGGEMLVMSITCWYVYTLIDPIIVNTSQDRS